MTGSADVTTWGAMTAGDVQRFGADILDPEKRKRWCSAILLGGLPYLWNHIAVDVRAKALAALDLKLGNRVLLIGEENEGIGFDREILEAIGKDGDLMPIDLREQVLAKVFAGERAQWRYDFTSGIADDFFDSILVGQGVAHAEDWGREGTELIRVLKPGGTLVMAEITFGPTFIRRLQTDMHLTYWVTKIMEGIGLRLEDFPSHDLPDIERALRGKLRDLHVEEWRGCELLWGKKPI